MQTESILTGNTNFYHGHIQSNIARLEERKDKFIHHRLQFIKKQCVPIQIKTQQILKEVQRYKIMKDTQEEVIQNQPEIVALKQEIQNYMNTHHYFQQRLDQFEKKQLQLDDYNRTLTQKIYSIKNNIKNNHQQLGFRLPDISKSRTTSTYQKTGNHLLRSFVYSETEDLLDQVSDSKSHYSFTKKMAKMNSKLNRIQSHIITQQSKKQQEVIIEDEQQQNQQPSKQLKRKIFTVRQKITAFNKIQTLFRQCFETKKKSIQKSVSQLQSKLIVHRTQFLNICQAISSKDKKVDFQSFNKLSCDQIITLFISFVWLNRKLSAEFMQKRKNIMDNIGKLPKIQ